MNKEAKKFPITKWIMTAFAVFLNSFIIFYSCLSQKTTNIWNDAITNVFTYLVNSFTSKEVENIPVENIEVKLSSQESHKYNYIPGYSLEEIPLGSAKQIECFFSPSNATNTTLTYNADPADSVILNQSGSTVSVVGVKEGKCVISATSKDGGFVSKVFVDIVKPIAPVSYELLLDSTDISLGTTKTLNFDIDGGVLTHDELVTFRYYDIRKLTYVSSNETAATVDSHGVIYPVSPGNTTITVSNGDYSKSINISIISGSSPTPYSNLSISGSDVCYANDMILDQSSKKNHYQLTPKDGEVELNPEDFIWESSNELLAKVDKHGVLRGFRKSSFDDEKVIISAISKTFPSQTASFEVIVKNQLPTTLNYFIVVGDREVWNKEDYTLFVGINTIINIRFDVWADNYDVFIESSNNNIVSGQSEGKVISLTVLNEGECVLTFGSRLNSDLTAVIKVTVIKQGAISGDNIDGVGLSIRKSLGHAGVFMVAQIFTLLAFFMFYPERKWYVWTSMSLGEGLFISGLSELIQFFIPSRSGAWLDVLIDFSGVVVGAALALLGIFIVKKIIAKRRAKQVESK